SVRDLPNDGERSELPYDVLIVAGGSRYSYFGHDEWAPYAPELKSLAGALDLRDQILLAYEAAEAETDASERQAWLTFVIVGAGPTGVEMAGQIAELGQTLRPEYRTVDTRSERVLLIEATDRVLGAFPDPLPSKAERQLRTLGVTPMLKTTVVGVDAHGVDVEDAAGGRTRIPARTVIWAAGVTASPLAAALAEAAEAAPRHRGRRAAAPP